MTATAEKLPLTTAAILANPLAYGLNWVVEKVERAGRTIPGVPVMVPTSVTKMLASFGEARMLELMLASSSMRVNTQRIARDNGDHDNTEGGKNKKYDRIRQLQVEWLLGIEGSTTTYGGPGGAVFATEEEAAVAWMAFAQAKLQKK